MLTITALYAGILGFVSIAISFVAGSKRGKSGISIGDGGDIELVAAMRRQANFLESVPLTLILIGVLEINGVGSTAIHALGAVLVASRISHAVGYRADDSLNSLRGAGAVGSALVMLISSGWAIVTFF